MIVLGALPDWILTLIRKTYAIALSEHHFSMCGRAAPAPLRNLQSLSFLPHLLGVSVPWKCISVFAFLGAFLDEEVPNNLTLEELCAAFSDLWCTAQISTAFEDHTRILYDYRVMVRQNLLVSLRHLVSWNISCWHPLHTGRDSKLTTVRKHLRKGPVCLQETKWTDAMATGLQQRLPAVRVVSTSAIQTEQGGLSGGTAILIPTSLEVLEVQEIVKGRILGALVSSRTSKFWIYSVYLHPVSKASELSAFRHFLQTNTRTVAPSIVAGDFNHANKELWEDWDHVVSILGVETTVKERATYHCHRGESSIDDILVPSDYVLNNSLWPSIFMEYNFVKSGHCTLCLCLKHRPSVTSSQYFPIHDTIPSTAFQPGKGVVDYRENPQRLGLDKLITRLAVVNPSFLDLQATFWQWWITEPQRKHVTFNSLRKFLHAKQSLVSVSRVLLKQLLEYCPAYQLPIEPLNTAKEHVVIPKQLLIECFDYLDTTALTEKGLTHANHDEKSMRGVGSQAHMWKQLRQSCPKTVFYNGPIQQGNGDVCTTDLQLQNAMLATRQFWFEEPKQEDVQWDEYLTSYEKTTAHWPFVDCPDETDYIKTLFFTKDSAPGPDGIPYSAWRLLPTCSAKAMSNFLLDVLQDKLSPPVSVQAWIPKAKLGPTADYFRPLGMPSTFERVVDGTIASVMAKIVAPHLHPSQVVLNDFREPQSGVHNIQSALDNNSSAIALSLDLSKAFERINPWWILRILAIRGAPYWVVKYTKYILFNRRSKQKVQGRLLPAKVIVTGVDMGRSFSVLLFCIAMDPILHYLHRIPGVIAVQGYVDDTTLVGDDVDQFEWLACVGRLCKDLESAGILVEPHRCWRAEWVNAPTCTPTQMEPGHPLEWLLQTEGKSTLTQAIQRAGLAGITHGCLAICRERSYCVINRTQVTDFLNRGSFEYLFDLLDVPCHCNNKCGILTNCVLSPLHFVALDKGHWGMHLLCDTLPALGLHLIGGFHICEKTWQPVNFQVTFKKLAPKAFAKILHRVALFSSPSHSIVKKSIAHSSFIQSCTYYPCTYLGFNEQDVREFRQMQSKLLLGRKWLVAEHCPHVLRWLNIAPSCDPGIEMTMAAIGYYMRKGGNALHLIYQNTCTLDRHSQMVKDIWNTWTSLISDSMLLHLVTQYLHENSHRAIGKFLKKLKALLYEKISEVSVNYLAHRARQAEWPGGITWEWLCALTTLSKQPVHGVTRFAILRWCLSEDDDEALALRSRGNLQSHRACNFCRSECKVYPYGLHREPVCDACCLLQHINAFTLGRSHVTSFCYRVQDAAFEELLIPHLHSNTIVPISGQLDQRSHDPCIACGCGDNSISHWSRFCIVPLLVFNYFCAETHVYVNLAQAVNADDHVIAVASVVLHQFRRLLLERGGMVHSQEARDLVKWNTQNWIDTLGELVHQALPAHMCSRSWYQLQSLSSCRKVKCCEHARLLQCVHTDPLHIMALTHADNVICANSEVSKGSTLAILPAGHSMLKLLHLQANDQAPNASLVRIDCQCPVPHFRVDSTDELLSNDLVNIGCAFQRQNQFSLLCQFDGSCHHSHQVGGAGYCIWLVCGESVQLLRQRAVGLHQCLDNIVAEVKACRFLVEEIVDVCHNEYASLNLTASPIVVQGDILPVIKYLEYAGRLRRLDLVADLEFIQKTACRMLPSIQWRYLPREANDFADSLAGQASQFLLDKLFRHYRCQSNVSIFPDTPFDKLIARGAEPKRCLNSRDKPSFTLCERPYVDWKLLNAVGDRWPAHVNTVSNYLARLASSGTALLTDYTPRSIDDKGRYYCVQVGAQRLPKVFRLALFGSNHAEIDMCGSFYELLRRVCIRENVGQLSLPPIFDLRASLQRDFDSLPSEICMDLVKRLPLRVMNSSLSSALFWLNQQGLQRPSEETLKILENIDVHTHFFASCLLPSLRPDYCPTDKDAPFRLFEMWEFEVMRNILEGLSGRGMISSAIWPHDGVWISPSPDPSTIAMLEASILRKLGLHCDQPFIRFTCLRPLLDDLRQSVCSVHCTSPKFATFVKWFRKDKQPHSVIFGRKGIMINPEGRDKHRKRRKYAFRIGIFRPKKVRSNLSFKK